MTLKPVFHLDIPWRGTSPNVCSFPPKCAEPIYDLLVFFLAFTILYQQTSADGMLIYSKECNERRSAAA